MRVLLELVLFSFCCVIVTAQNQRLDCDEEGNCVCIKGWIGEPTCLTPNPRSPHPCSWVDQERYFKHQSAPKQYLKQLKCRDRRLRNLDKIEIRGDTEWLDLGFNRLGDVTSLKEDVMQYLPELKAVSFDRAGISSIRGDLFSMNSLLESVDLQWNHITEIPENLFANNTKLVRVTLRGNQFQTIPRRLFYNNPELRELRIDFSGVIGLPLTLFKHNPNFRYLDASYCTNLLGLSDAMFDYTPSIEFVGLLNTWFLHPAMRKHFCDQEWCQKARYSPVSRLRALLREYFG